MKCAQAVVTDSPKHTWDAQEWHVKGEEVES